LIAAPAGASPNGSAREARVLVTLDKHFGQHIFLAERKHSGLVRLPDVPAAKRVTLMKQVLKAHAEDLAASKVVTIRGSRIRVSDPPQDLESQ
jgi:predicted nuclease of predicted toxin-antitoxin system